MNERTTFGQWIKVQRRNLGQTPEVLAEQVVVPLLHYNEIMPRLLSMPKRA